MEAESASKLSGRETEDSQPEPTHRLNVLADERASILTVKQTSLPECDFLGLFTTSFIPQGAVICTYTGEILSTREAMRLSDKSYLMRIGEQCYVDAKNCLNVQARYINDCVTPSGWNVTFDKRLNEKCAYVVAIRDILPGEELFVDYGRWYWIGKKPVKLAVKFNSNINSSSESIVADEEL